MSCIYFFLTALTLCQPSLEQRGTNAVETKYNLAYSLAPDADRRHRLDLHVPKEASNFPMILFVHGGSWKDGDKWLYRPLGEMFASHGIGVAVVNYRLSRPDNKVKHPDHIKDVAKAFTWLKANAAKHGGDPARIFLMGHSAGGHLASLLATDESYLRAEGCSVRDIRGVMSLSGVYSILSMPVFDAAFEKNSAVRSAASPTKHVKGVHPSFLVAYADKDEFGLAWMADLFAGQLKSAKSPVKLLQVKNRGHISILVRMVTQADDPLASAVFEFIEKAK